MVGGGTASNGASEISLAGTNSASNLHAVRKLFTYDDQVAICRGVHQLEAGVWLERLQANDNLAQNQYGQASFDSLTSLLEDAVSTFSVVPSPTPLSWRSLEIGGFVQDAMKLRPNLDFRIGFRFESTDEWNEAHRRASNYVLVERRHPNQSDDGELRTDSQSRQVPPRSSRGAPGTPLEKARPSSTPVSASTARCSIISTTDWTRPQLSTRPSRPSR